MTFWHSRCCTDAANRQPQRVTSITKTQQGKKIYFTRVTRPTKCSRQSSTARNGGESKLEIADRLHSPAFATISGSTSILSL